MLGPKCFWILIEVFKYLQFYNLFPEPKSWIGEETSRKILRDKAGTSAGFVIYYFAIFPKELFSVGYSVLLGKICEI